MLLQELSWPEVGNLSRDLPVLVPEHVDPVLLGAAMLGATASGAFMDLRSAMATMAPTAIQYLPTVGAIRSQHERRFAAFARNDHQPVRPGAVL